MMHLKIKTKAKVTSTLFSLTLQHHYKSNFTLMMLYLSCEKDTSVTTMISQITFSYLILCLLSICLHNIKIQFVESLVPEARHLMKCGDYVKGIMYN